MHYVTKPFCRHFHKWRHLQENEARTFLIMAGYMETFVLDSARLTFMSQLRYRVHTAQAMT